MGEIAVHAAAPKTAAVAARTGRKRDRAGTRGGGPGPVPSGASTDDRCGVVMPPSPVTGSARGRVELLREAHAVVLEAVVQDRAEGEDHGDEYSGDGGDHQPVLDGSSPLLVRSPHHVPGQR